MSDRARSLGREIAELGRSELALRLTLVALLLQPVGTRWTRPATLALAAAGLLFDRVRRSPALWASLAALATWRVVAHWPLGDNHAFLLAYWLLAAFVGVLASDGERVLAWNGRVLVGLTFAFATLWKVALSPDFLDGRFFLVTLVDDSRFEGLALVAGGLDPDSLAALRDLVRAHVDGPSPSLPGDPELPARLVALARGLTLATVALEAALAAAFLAPSSWRLGRARDALLLLFCAGTYAVAPVEGFGWLLLSMGVAQSEPGRVRVRIAYLAAFALVLLGARWPWLDALARR